MKTKYFPEVSSLSFTAELSRVLPSLIKVRQMSDLNLKLASNYISMKEERFDNFLVREVVKPEDFSVKVII